MKSSICLERQPTPGTESTAVGTTATQSHADGFADRLWREHDVLASQLTRLEAAADAFDNAELSLSALRSELDAAHELLAGQIVPHMRSADDYQRVLAQRDYVSSPAGPEHEEAERLASKLGRLRDQIGVGNVLGARRETRRLLHELYALTRPHFGTPRGPK
jgi:hypothetical protein